jgi:hypothetical protein
MSRKKWTSDEHSFLIANYMTMPAKEVAHALQRTETSISNTASRLGLKKSSQERGESIKQGRLRMKRERNSLFTTCQTALAHLKNENHSSATQCLEDALIGKSYE